MSRVLEVEHRPEVGVRVRFRNLIQGRVVLINDLVNGRDDSRVLYCPAQIAGRLASNDVGRFGTFGDRWEGRRRAAGIAVGRKELGDAKVALG